MNYLLEHNDNTMKIYKCYEGTLMSLFFNKGKWYLSTRRCLDSKSSIWNQHSHFDLFMEVINEEGFETFDDFTKNLNENYCYNFILIHHNNKNIVDYTKKFGENYKKLCLAFVRNKNDLTEIEYNKIENIMSFKDFKNIFISEEVDSLETYTSNLNNYNKNDMLNCSDEGIIIKTVNENKVETYLKIQTYPYQFHKAIGLEKIFSKVLSIYIKMIN